MLLNQNGAVFKVLLQFEDPQIAMEDILKVTELMENKGRICEKILR